MAAFFVIGSEVIVSCLQEIESAAIMSWFNENYIKRGVKVEQHYAAIKKDSYRIIGTGAVETIRSNVRDHRI